MKPDLCCWCWYKAEFQTSAQTAPLHSHTHQTEMYMGCCPASGWLQGPSRGEKNIATWTFTLCFDTSEPTQLLKAKVQEHSLCAVLGPRCCQAGDQVRGMETHHPQDGSTGLLHLLRATPPGLDCRQAKVTYFNCPALMEKNIWQPSWGNDKSMFCAPHMQMRLVGHYRTGKETTHLLLRPHRWLLRI